MNIFVTVKPKARQEKVELVDSTHYIVYTNKIPERGKANAGVIQLLSNYFSIPKSHITILSGTTSRLKIVSINT